MPVILMTGIFFCLAKADTVARWGGEEFVLLLPSTTIETALAIAEKTRQAVFESELLVGNQIHKLSASFGVAVSKNPIHNLSNLLERADNALYKAKNKGRNFVCWEEQE